MPARVKNFFVFFILSFLFSGTQLRSLRRVVLFVPLNRCFDDHGSFVIFRSFFSPTQTSLRSVLRPRLLIQTPFAGSGMPNQVDGFLLHTMSGIELSHVRTEL